MTSLAVRRLQKELIQVRDLSNVGIYYLPSQTNLQEGRALIWGPEESCYAHCPLFFKFEFPEAYPFEPPKVTFLTSDGRTRLHPNLYVSGKVCLSILGTWSGPSWQSTMSLSMVLLSLKALLDSNPLAHEPGYEKLNLQSPRAHQYSEYVKHQSMKLAITEIYKRNYLELFEDLIPHVIPYHRSKLIDTICEKKRVPDVYYTQLPYNMEGRTEWNKLYKVIEHGTGQTYEFGA